jgi:hypothetical protein
MVRVLEGTGVEVTQAALGSGQSTWAMVEDILADAIKPDDIQNWVNLRGGKPGSSDEVTLRGIGLLYVYEVIVKRCATEHAETAAQHSLHRKYHGILIAPVRSGFYLSAICIFLMPFSRK